MELGAISVSLGCSPLHILPLTKALLDVGNGTYEPLYGNQAPQAPINYGATSA